MKITALVLGAACALMGQTAPVQQQPHQTEHAGKAGIFYQSSEYRETQAMMEGFTKRFHEALAREDGLTLVTVNRVYGDGSAAVHSNCEKSGVVAFVYPFYRFSIDQNTASVLAALRVIDCYGIPFYAKAEIKSESRLFVNRSGERELTDMGNHLIDLLLADFQQFKTAHSAEWRNLLKYGIAADPPNATRSLFVAVFLNFPADRTKPATATIDFVRPDGLGAKAGLQEGDEIVSIDGAAPDINNTSGMQIAQQMESARTVVVRRQLKEISITLSPPSVGRAQ